jgi:tripartite-type tricarboxylate transporter receptor subunit TctC
MRQDHSIQAERAGGFTASLRGARIGTALATAALLLAACGAGGGSPAPTTGGSPAGGSPAAGSPGGGGANYPTGNITFVVPFDAGGPTDTVTRLIAAPMGTELGVTVIIENVPGAGGTVAAGQVAGSPPDGYRVLMHHIGMSTAPTLYPDLDYDPLTDFETIGLVTEVPMAIVARPDFPPTDLQGLIDYVGDPANVVTYANAGRGAASHLCGLLFEKATDLDVVEVSYTGTAPAKTDLLGGHVDFMCDQTTNVSAEILAGTVKAYAVTTPARVASLPEVPTTEEAGFGDIAVGVWHGLYVPAGTPEEIVTALSDALKVALQDQKVIDDLAKLGAAPVAQDQATPSALTALLEEQIGLWAPILEAAPTLPPPAPTT